MDWIQDRSNNVSITTKQLQMKMKFTQEGLQKNGLQADADMRADLARQFIGECLYLSSRTHLGIAYSGGQLAMTSSCPTDLWWHEARTLMKYLQLRSEQNPRLVYKPGRRDKHWCRR